MPASPRQQQPDDITHPVPYHLASIIGLLVAYMIVGGTMFALVGPVWTSLVTNVIALGPLVWLYRCSSSTALRSALGCRPLTPAIAAGLTLVVVVGPLTGGWVLNNTDSNSFETLQENIDQFHPAVLVLAVVVITPLVEELLFRGFVYTRLRAIAPVPVAALGSSALFALLHSNLVQLSYTFFFGLLAAIVLERTGQLRWPIIIHMLTNACSLFTPFADWGQDMHPGPVLALNVLQLATLGWCLRQVSRRRADS